MIEAIVVGGVDVGDAHRIVRLITAERGRISVMARNARGSRKRFVGVLDMGTQMRVEVRKGRGDLPLLQAAESLSGLDRARKDLLRLSLATYGCEVIDGLCPEEHQSPKMFKLLEVWLGVLEGVAEPGTATRLALEAKALTFSGVAPVLMCCALCNGPLEAAMRFDPEVGGALHVGCGAGRELTRENLVLLEALRRTPMAETTGDYPVDPRISWVLSDFIQVQLQRALKSRDLLSVL